MGWEDPKSRPLDDFIDTAEMFRQRRQLPKVKLYFTQKRIDYLTAEAEKVGTTLQVELDNIATAYGYPGGAEIVIVENKGD